MRTPVLIVCALLAASAAIAETNTPPAAAKPETARASSAESAATNVVAITVQDTAMLALALPSGGKAYTRGTRTVVRTPNSDVFFELWPVAGAKTVDDALARYVDLLKQEDVRDLQVTGTREITLAGAPAKVITAAGVEVDDGDPGKAEVVLFAAAGRVFLACVHGEQMTAAETKSMLDVLQTARRP